MFTAFDYLNFLGSVVFIYLQYAFSLGWGFLSVRLGPCKVLWNSQLIIIDECPRLEGLFEIIF